MNIIRVFPRRTSYTPDDDMAFIGNPPLVIPEHDEVHDFSDFKTEYSKDWNEWARMWQRPAATVSHMERGTSYGLFNT